MKPLFTFLLILNLSALFFTANGQMYFEKFDHNVGIGIKGGGSITNLSAGASGNNPLTSGYSSIAGPDASLFLEFKITDDISFEPAIEYSTEGGKKDGLQAFPTPAAIAVFYAPATPPTYLYANFNNKVQLKYFLVPLLLKIGWDLGDGPARFYIAGGPFLGYLYKATQVSSGSSDIYSDSKGTQPLPLIGSESFANNQNLKPQLQTINYGLAGNIGLSVRLDGTGQNQLSFEVGGNYGLENIQKVAANGKNNTGAAVATLGYSFWF